MYTIEPYTKEQAKKLNVIVKPSTRAGKKLDVYDSKGNYITSIGDINYLDYPKYLKKYGKTIAEQRRKLYYIRHEKDRKIKGTAGYYASHLLW